MKNFELVDGICRYGSFSKAADELHISQSSLSMAIQRIESEVGVPLFDRRQHPVMLTEAGEAYVGYYRKIKPFHADMQMKIQDIAHMKRGSFSLGGTHYLLSYILPEAIVRFANQYPGIDFRIVESQSERFKSLLLNCDIDLCLKCDVSDPQIHAICPAFFDKLYLAVPKEQVEPLNLAKNALTGTQIREKQGEVFEHYFRIEDLEKMTFLQLTPGNNLCNRSERIFEHLGAKPKKIIRFNQFVTAYNLAGSGLGCTLASSRLIEQINHPNLVYYELPTPLMIREFHFATRKDAYISKSIRAFCELFAQAEDEKRKKIYSSR